MKNKLIPLLASLASMMLIAAASLSLASCGDTTPGGTSSAETPATSVSSAVDSETPSTDEPSSTVSHPSGTPDDGTEHVGEGATQFRFTATLLDGREKAYTVSTDKTTVGDALVEVGLISGTEGPYGLYVDTVCGEKHLFEEDGKYWAFYIDGEYAMTGVDKTEITAGAAYQLKAE